MITTFDMATGKLSYQTDQAVSTGDSPEHDKLIEQTLSLQLIEVAIQSQPKTIPPDLASIPVDIFLGNQS